MHFLSSTGNNKKIVRMCYSLDDDHHNIPINIKGKAKWNQNNLHGVCMTIQFKKFMVFGSMADDITNTFNQNAVIFIATIR